MSATVRRLQTPPAQSFETPGPLLLSIREAAREAGTGRDFMYELVRTGRVRSVSVGRRRLVPRLELSAWIERELGGGGEPVGNGAGKDEAPDPIAAGPRA